MKHISRFIQEGLRRSCGLASAAYRYLGHAIASIAQAMTNICHAKIIQNHFFVRWCLVLTAAVKDTKGQPHVMSGYYSGGLLSG